MPYTYDYPRPALTVDCVIFGRDESPALKVLVIERAQPPFQGKWALPGGFVDENETVEQAAQRELEEETGLKQSSMKQLGVFSQPGRDPRGWVVSVAFYTLVNIRETDIRAGDDAAQAHWLEVSALQNREMAFDHQQILAQALSFIALSFIELSE
ncbi:MAG: NUDIX hydrolase [Bacteroidia bacterium]|nr:NUDIX hydrolase [Bacteroidia bacterium]